MDELLKMIRSKINLINRPSDEELRNIVNELVNVKRRKGFVDDSDLLDAVKNCVIDIDEWLFESVDMSSLENVAEQIIAKFGSVANG